MTIPKNTQTGQMNLAGRAEKSNDAPVSLTSPVITGYPIPGWMLEHLGPKKEPDRPQMWIAALKRTDSCLDGYGVRVVQAQSDVGPEEAFKEAVKMAIRDEDRRVDWLKEQEIARQTGEPEQD